MGDAVDLGEHDGDGGFVASVGVVCPRLLDETRAMLGNLTQVVVGGTEDADPRGEPIEGA